MSQERLKQMTDRVHELLSLGRPMNDEESDEFRRIRFDMFAEHNPDVHINALVDMLKRFIAEANDAYWDNPYNGTRKQELLRDARELLKSPGNLLMQLVNVFKSRISDLEEENKFLRDFKPMTPDDIAAVKLHFEGQTRDGKIRGTGMAEIFVQPFQDLFTEVGAKNYVEVKMKRDDGVELTCLIQAPGGKTPADVASELKEDVEEKEAALKHANMLIKTLGNVINDRTKIETELRERIDYLQSQLNTYKLSLEKSQENTAKTQKVLDAAMDVLNRDQDRFRQLNELIDKALKS